MGASGTGLSLRRGGGSRDDLGASGTGLSMRRGAGSRDDLGASGNGLSLRRGGGDNFSYGDAEIDDNLQDEEYEQEKQEWQEKRADKQKAMLERLKGNKSSENAATTNDEKSLGDDPFKNDPFGEDPFADDPFKNDPFKDGPFKQGEDSAIPEAGKTTRSRRKSMGASLTKKFGMSSTNFASFEEEDSSKKNSRKSRVTADGKKPESRKSMPLRHKSQDGVPGSRARAADSDRRRRGTMMDRIGG